MGYTSDTLRNEAYKGGMKKMESDKKTGDIMSRVTPSVKRDFTEIARSLGYTRPGQLSALLIESFVTAKKNQGDALVFPPKFKSEADNAPSSPLDIVSDITVARAQRIWKRLFDLKSDRNPDDQYDGRFSLAQLERLREAYAIFKISRQWKEGGALPKPTVDGLENVFDLDERTILTEEFELALSGKAAPVNNAAEPYILGEQLDKVAEGDSAYGNKKPRTFEIPEEALPEIITRCEALGITVDEYIQRTVALIAAPHTTAGTD